MKIGRNHPCPCGSGKKYKKCCLSNGSFELPPEVLAKLQENALKDKLRQQQFGHVRPIIHTDFKGQKFVVVGSQLCYSDMWETFPDFLAHYACGVLGKKWGDAELQKPLNERHQIMKWYDCLCRFQQKQVRQDNGIYNCIPNGAYTAFIYLAYELYTLRHHQSLQSEVVSRLKHKEQFQGARYELFVAATCIRAGFDIKYENENDVTTKHPEFLAVHRDTKQIVAVEAKSRHRHGVLDFHDKETKAGQVKAGIGNLLQRALQKAGQYPYVIFFDLNLPPSSEPLFARPIAEELKNTIDYACRADENLDNFNMLIFTNHPYHYVGEDEPAPPTEAGMFLSKKPKILPTFPETVLGIFHATQKFNNIPNEFPD